MSGKKNTGHPVKKFKNHNFDFPDSPRTDQIFILYKNRLIELLRKDNRQTCREPAEKMNSDVITYVMIPDNSERKD
uniref:Transposase n=1 Tax=Strongyloides venezuelensis TaxID=75913 RepID=A0A0K0FQL0_STRVS